MRPANVRQISLIDWEFATCAPAFVDLAHFLSEVWLQERFRPQSSHRASANVRVAVALISSYRLAGGTINSGRIARYVGGHICCFLDYGNWTTDMALIREVAREGLALMLESVDQDCEIIKDPVLALLLKL